MQSFIVLEKPTCFAFKATNISLTCKYICKYMHTYFLISPCTINHDPSFYINFILHFVVLNQHKKLL